MAILITNDGDKTVANIGARDAITRKFDGMNVTVLDAIADTSVGGGGVAGYQWSSTLSRWMLMFKENKDNLTFLRENLVITNGAVTSQYAPAGGLVWDCVIIDGNGLIVADVFPTITGNTIAVDSSAYNDLYLNFTYAYGIAEAAAGVITKSSIGLGNVDNTSDLAKPISVATQSALNLKADIATTYTKTETIAAISLYAPAPATYTTLAEYGITDAYTINESNTRLNLKANLASPTFTGTVSGITAAMVGAQVASSELTGLAGIVATSGLVKKTAAGTYSLDTNTYLTANQAITLTGDVTGTGNGSFATTLANTAVTAGTYGSGTDIPTITVDSKGRITGVTTNAVSGGGGGGSISVADDIATVATYYPTFATVTSGTLSTIKTSSTQLTYTPSTGTLFATNFSSSSDLNLKDHISTVINGLTVIDSLNPISFKWKDSGAASFGVIAQELELVVPELVSTSADTGYKAVNYDGLIAFLISAVKDLSQQVAELKAK